MSLILASFASVIHPLGFYVVMVMFGTAFIFFHVQTINQNAKTEGFIFTDLTKKTKTALLHNENNMTYKRHLQLKEFCNKGPLVIIMCYIISSACTVFFLRTVEITTFSSLSTSIACLCGIVFGLIFTSLDS